MKAIVHLTIEGTIEIDGQPFRIYVPLLSGGSMTPELLGKRLRHLRQGAELTLVQLGGLSKVGPSHIGRIERSERYPGVRVLAKLERALTQVYAEQHKEPE